MGSGSARGLPAPVVLAVALSLALGPGCRCGAPPEVVPTTGPQEERIDQLRRRADEFSDENLETIRSHRPDVGLRLQVDDSGG